MSISVVLILVGIMCVGMILLVIGYLNRGYSYKHTIDDLPDPVQKQEKQNEPKEQGP